MVLQEQHVQWTWRIKCRCTVYVNCISHQDLMGGKKKLPSLWEELAKNICDVKILILTVGDRSCKTLNRQANSLYEFNTMMLRDVYFRTKRSVGASQWSGIISSLQCFLCSWRLVSSQLACRSWTRGLCDNLGKDFTSFWPITWLLLCIIVTAAVLLPSFPKWSRPFFCSA